jgi:hypothetical protein
MFGLVVYIGRVGHGSTRGYQGANPYPDPRLPYPVRVGSKQTRTGLPAGGDLPAGLETRVRVIYYLNFEIVSLGGKNVSGWETQLQ